MKVHLQMSSCVVQKTVKKGEDSSYLPAMFDENSSDGCRAESQGSDQTFEFTSDHEVYSDTCCGLTIGPGCGHAEFGLRTQATFLTIFTANSSTISYFCHGGNLHAWPHQHVLTERMRSL